MALAPFGPEKLTSVGSVPVSRKVKDVPVVRGREVQLFPRTLDPLVIDAATDFAVTMEDYRMMVRFRQMEEKRNIRLIGRIWKRT